MPSPVTTYQNVRLARGRHDSPDDGACVMELVSMLAGEEFSDRPRTACPVVGAFLRAYNDLAPPSRRQDLLGCASRLVGSRNPHAERERMHHCVRVALALHDRQPWWRRVAEANGRARLLRIDDGPLDSFALDELGYRVARLVRHAPGGRSRAVELVEQLTCIGETETPPAPVPVPVIAA